MEEECAERIKNTFYETINVGIDPIKGRTSIEERETIADKFISLFYKNCDKESMASDVAISTEANYLVIEAIECFRKGLLESSMVMLRAAIDSILLTITKNKLWRDKTNLRGASPVYNINKVDIRNEFQVGEQVWSEIKNLFVENGLSVDDITLILDQLKDTREKGHFSAHFYSKHLEEFQNYIKNYVEIESKNLPEEDKMNLLQEIRQRPYYITYDEAKNTLESTINNLIKIRECAFHTAQYLNEN